LLNRPLLCQLIDEVKDLPTWESTDFKDFLTQKLKVLPTNKSFSKKQVLILTKILDPEADFVGIELLRRGIDYVRLNIEDIPKKMRIKYFVLQGPDANVEFGLRKHLINTSNISVVWLRDFDMKTRLFGEDELTSTFAFQQWNHALRILQRRLTCEWINNPNAMLLAEDRIAQLSIAKTLGFDAPQTLITNDPKAAREFYHAHDGNIVLKALHHHGIEVHGKLYSMYTHMMEQKDLPKLKDLIHAPCILQERLVKRSELRVTVVGERVFAAELDSQSTKDGREDWHRCSMGSLPKSIVQMENLANERCIKIIKKLGLRYGAIDFIIDKNDQLNFLEVNPTGDWYWIEGQTGLPITEAVVDLIEEFTSSSSCSSS
jgi:glutathione synthase/RimK-type ligase-like ATP-grasp enzyme